MTVFKLCLQAHSRPVLYTAVDLLSLFINLLGLQIQGCQNSRDLTNCYVLCSIQ